MPIDTSLLTDQQVRDLPVDQLAAALTAAAGPEDNARRAAVHILTNYGDHSLLRLRHIRAYIVAAGTDGPLVQWSRLARHLTDTTAEGFNPAHHRAHTDPRQHLWRVDGSALDALRIAVSLGDSTYQVGLRSPAGRFGHVNRETIAAALVMAFTGRTP